MSYFNENMLTQYSSLIVIFANTEYTEWTEINQEMQMNPADSLHN